MKKAEPHWKVIYTASRQEKKVADLLGKLGIEHYLPVVKKLRMWSDRKKWVEMPLFNGYVFVRPESGQRDRLLDIPGVVRYLRYNGEDALMRQDEIALIQKLILKGYTMDQAAPALEKGDKVMIETGPLKGIEAEVLQGGEGESYILVTFETISQTIRVNLPAGLLKKLKPA